MLPRIIHLLQINNFHIQYEASWCITNIVSQNSADAPEYTAHVVRSNALIPLLNVLKIPKYPLQERALSAIGNIGGESRKLKDMILKHNLLQLLIETIKNPIHNDSHYEYKYDDTIPDTINGQYLELINTLSWALTNFSYGTGNDNNDESIKYKMLIIECAYHLIQTKNQFISSERNEINLNIICSIQYIMPVDYKYPNTVLNYLDELNVLKHVISLLDIENKCIYRSIVNTILIILEGDTTNSGIYTQICLDYGILKRFQILNVLIRNNDDDSLQILKAICLSIAKINSYFQFVNSVMDTNLFPIVCKLLVKQSIVSNAALWCVANAIYTACENHNENIIQHLLNQNKCNLIKYLCDYNKMHFMNGSWGKNMEKRLKISLDCMENIFSNGKLYVAIFEEYNGLEFLEYMETVNNLSELLYDRIMIIKNEYFGSESDIQQNYMNNNFDRMEITFDNINRQM